MFYERKLTLDADSICPKCGNSCDFVAGNGFAFVYDRTVDAVKVTCRRCGYYELLLPKNNLVEK